MKNLTGKTAKEIQALVDAGTVSKADATQHLMNNGARRVSKGRKPTFASLKALQGFTAKSIDVLREEINALAGAPASKKPKKSKPSHDALDTLAVAYVESDVLKLCDSKTTQAAIARMNQGRIKDPIKVANLREAERRLAPKQTNQSARIDALESKLDELLRIFS